MANRVGVVNDFLQFSLEDGSKLRIKTIEIDGKLYLLKEIEDLYVKIANSLVLDLFTMREQCLQDEIFLQNLELSQVYYNNFSNESLEKQRIIEAKNTLDQIKDGLHRYLSSPTNRSYEEYDEELSVKDVFNFAISNLKRIYSFSNNLSFEKKVVIGSCFLGLYSGSIQRAIWYSAFTFTTLKLIKWSRNDR